MKWGVLFLVLVFQRSFPCLCLFTLSLRNSPVPGTVISMISEQKGRECGQTGFDGGTGFDVHKQGGTSGHVL